jgi:subtilisin family serine protease
MKYFIALFFLLLSPALASEHKTLKVAVVDTGLDLKDDRFQGFICPTGHKDFTGEGLKDINGHGTHVTGLIEKNAGIGNYCFLIYKYYSEKQTGHQNLINEIKAFQAAVENGADIVNFSGGGPKFNEQEYNIIKENPYVTFVVASGNEGHNLNINCDYYPACLKLANMVIVGNCKNKDNYNESSNRGDILTTCNDGNHVLSSLPNGYFGYMSGSSQSTAIETGKLIRLWVERQKR